MKWKKKTVKCAWTTDVVFKCNIYQMERGSNIPKTQSYLFRYKHSWTRDSLNNKPPSCITKCNTKSIIVSWSLGKGLLYSICTGVIKLSNRAECNIQGTVLCSLMEFGYEPYFAHHSIDNILYEFVNGCYCCFPLYPLSHYLFLAICI